MRAYRFSVRLDQREWASLSYLAALLGKTPSDAIRQCLQIISECDLEAGHNDRGWIASRHQSQTSPERGGEPSAREGQ